MSAFRFSKGQQFVWKGKLYTVLQRRNSQVNVEDFTGMVTTVDYGLLVYALDSGELRFVIEGKHSKSVDGETFTTESKHQDLDLDNDKWAQIARYRSDAIQPLLQIPKGVRTRKDVKARVAELRSLQAGSVEHSMLMSVSVTSLYRWLRYAEQSGNDLRALIPEVEKRGGKGHSRLDAQVDEIIEKTIDDKYHVREKVTIEDVYHEVVLRILEHNQSHPKDQHLRAPSLRTIARRIKALDAKSLFVTKHGAKAAKRQFTQYGQVEHPSLPLERVEFDHTTLDVIVVDSEDRQPLDRPTLTIAIDAATRFPLGYYLGFEPPSHLAVMECLYHVFRPKEDTSKKYGTEHRWIAYGIPATIVVDNGKEFISQDLEDACRLLGIKIQRTPIAEPYCKGIVERMYGSLNTLLVHKIPGTTFSNPKERGDYDSAGKAELTLTELERILNLTLVDIYPERFHRGIRGFPARQWEAAIQSGFSPRLQANIEDLSIWLGRTIERTVQHYGIEFGNLYYNCEALSRLRNSLPKGEHVKVKYHPGDISFIYVQDRSNHRYIKVPALAENYMQGGMSLWQHRIINKAVLEEQGTVDIEGLARTKRKIAAVLQESKSNTRKATRSRKARWEGDKGKAKANNAQVEPEEITCPTGHTLAKLDNTECNARSRDELQDWGKISFDLPRSRDEEGTEQ